MAKQLQGDRVGGGRVAGIIAVQVIAAVELRQQSGWVLGIPEYRIEVDQGIESWVPRIHSLT